MYPTKKILLADDDWKIRRLLKFRLEKLGFEVHDAASEKKLWEMAFTVDPDLVILDVLLWKRLGTDIYDHLLEFGFDSDIPVIFISGMLDRQRRSMSENGRYALLSKPIDFERLVQMIYRMTLNRRYQTVAT